MAHETADFRGQGRPLSQAPASGRWGLDLAAPPRAGAPRERLEPGAGS
jgi:hypothetical protein